MKEETNPSPDGSPLHLTSPDPREDKMKRMTTSGVCAQLHGEDFVGDKGGFECYCLVVGEVRLPAKEALSEIW